MGTIVAFCSCSCIRVDIYRIIWAGLHTGFASNADVWIEINDAISTLVHCCNRADAYARWIGAVVATRNLEMAARAGIDARIHIFYPGTIHTKWYLVFTLAGSGTCVTTDTLAIIDDEAVIHDTVLLCGLWSLVVGDWYHP